MNINKIYFLVSQFIIHIYF